MRLTTDAELKRRLEERASTTSVGTIVSRDQPSGLIVSLGSPPVQVRIEPASDETRRRLETWRYPPPYDFYDGDAEPVLDPDRYFEARDERGDLIGFYYFEPKPPDLDYGLGLHPDLTGRGLGLEFFLAGLAFARERYRPRRVLLHVAEFNARARRVYERGGFRVVSSHLRTFERFGEVRFLTMADADEP